MGQTVELNGTKIYYEDEGQGRPVVLIHGFTLDTRMWDDQWDALKEHYRVIRYDQRGFGRSDLPETEPYTPTDDLRALLDHLSIARADVIGLSLGGNIAVQLAVESPERVRSLVLIGSVLGGWGWSDAYFRESGPVWTEGAKDVARGRELWMALSLFAPANEQPAVAARLAAMVDDYSGYHWTDKDPQVYPDPPPLAHLARIQAPALVVIGDRDIPDILATADALAEKIPAARKVTLPGIGHMANMEAPAEVNRLILEFLEEL